MGLGLARALRAAAGDRARGGAGAGAPDARARRPSDRRVRHRRAEASAGSPALAARRGDPDRRRSSDAGSADPAAPATTRAARGRRAGSSTGEKRLRSRRARSRSRVLVPAATDAGRRDLPRRSAAPTASRSRGSGPRAGEPLFDLRSPACACGERAARRRRRRREPSCSRWLARRARWSRSAPRRSASPSARSRSPPATCSERVQFGVPIGSFQAVQHRMRRRLHRPRGDALDHLARGLEARAAAAGARAKRGREVLGGRGRRAHRDAPPSTCTAAWASTSTTRSTATSCGRRPSSSSSAAPTPQLVRLGRDMARSRAAGAAMSCDARPRFEDVKRRRRAARARASPLTTQPDRRRRPRLARLHAACTTTRPPRRPQGMQDVFMNILTTNGLVGRYVTDWAGPDARVRRASRSSSARRTCPATR